MPNHLSVLGIIHTAISIVALIAGFTALYKTGKIDPKDSPGRWYVLLTVTTCLTGLPIMKTGHLSGGHYLGIMILVLLPLGIYAGRIFGRAAGYLQLFIMSTTLFLSMVPAAIETLTRLPMSHPLATGPNDPFILKALSGVILVYVVGVAYQLVKHRTLRKAARVSA